MPFWGAIRLRTNTGNYVSHVEDTSDKPVMGTLSNYDATYNGGTSVTVECDYTHPALDALLGFKVYIGSLPSPDWGSATDVGLTGGDAGNPVEHFSWNLATGAMGTVYFAIRAYGNDGEEDLYVDTPLFSIVINPEEPVLNTPFDVTASTFSDDRLDIQWSYEHPEFDKLEGFKVWVSSNPTPDWDTAYDNGLLNGDSVSPVETFNLPYTYGDFGTTYVIVQAYGDGETKVSETFEFEHEREKVLFPANITHIAKPASDEVRVVFDYLWASYDGFDDVNMLEGFKIYVSTDPIPNWTTAFDNELNNGSGKPVGGGIETFDVLITNSDTGIVFITVQSYGEGQTRETQVARVFAETEPQNPEIELNVDAPMMDLPLRQRTQLCATPTGHLSPTAWLGDKIVGWTKLATFENIVGTGLTTVTNDGYILSVNTPDIRLLDNLWTGENTFDEVNASVVNADNFYGDGSGITGITLPQLSDVTVTTPANGQVLTYNGSQWVNSSAITGYVPTSRTISTTSPLTGGGDLSANRTISIPKATSSADGYLSSADWSLFDGKVSPTRNVSTGLGLTGGGNLSADRTIAIDTAVVPQLGANNTFTGSNSFNTSINVYDESFVPKITFNGDGIIEFDETVPYFNINYNITAPSFSGDGANITDINASNIASGTIDNARLPTTAQKFSGEVTISSGDNFADMEPIPIISAGDTVVVSYKGASNGGGALWADTDTLGGWAVFSTNIVYANTTIVWRVLKN